MIYKVPSLYYLHHFPPLAAVFLLGTSWITLKSLLFSLRLRVCVVVFIHEKENSGSVFPAFCHATFHHTLITCCNVSRAGYIA